MPQYFQNYGQTQDPLELLTQSGMGIGQGLVGALGKVGSILDLPASTVRDLVAGKGAAESFDQWVDPFNEQKRVSGRDLLRQGGLVGNQDTYGNFFGGLAAEVAMDPLILLGGAATALSKGGKAARALGLLDKAKVASGHAGRRAARKGTSLRGVLKGGRENLKRLPGGSDVAGPIGELGGDVRRALAKQNVKGFRETRRAMTEPLGSDLNIGLPGFNKNVNLPGPLSQALDKFETAALASAPVRGVRALADARVGGKYVREDQIVQELDHAAEIGSRFRMNRKLDEANDFVTSNLVQYSAAKAAKEKAAELGVNLPPGLQNLPARAQEMLARNLPPDLQKEIDNAHTGITTANYKTAIPGDTLKAFDREVKAVWEEPERMAGRVSPEAERVVGTLRQQQEDMFADLDRRGVKINKHMPDAEFGGAAHMARYTNILGASAEKKAAYTNAVEQWKKNNPGKKFTKDIEKELKNFVSSKHTRLNKYWGRVTTARMDIIRHIPANDLDDMAQDPLVHDGTLAESADYILNKWNDKMMGNYVPEDKPAGIKRALKHADSIKGQGGRAQRVEKVWNEAVDTPSEIKKFDPLTGKMVKDETFLGTAGPHPDQAWFDRTGPKGYHAWDVAKVIRAGPKRALYVPFDESHRAYMRSGGSIAKSLDVGYDYLARNILSEGGVPAMSAFRTIGLDPGKAMRYFASEFPTAKSLDPGDIKFSRQSIEAVKQLIDPMENPDKWTKKIGEAFDAVNGLTRGALTVPWPAFHARNQLSGLFVNYSSGHIVTPADHAAYIKSFGDESMIRELQQAGGLDTGKGVIGGKPVEGTGFQSDLDTSKINYFIEKAMDLGPEIKGKKLGDWTAGGYQRQIIERGSRWMEWVEKNNRLPMYTYLRKHKGWSVEAAAKEVEKLHFDYSDLSDIEKAYAKRAFLFYTFSRRMAPLMIDNLLSRPGGLMANVLKASGVGRTTGVDPSKLMPDYVRKSLAIPLGQDDEGNDRYFTGFGLPHEDTTSLLGPLATGDISGTINEAGSRLAPMFKLPIEHALQSSFQRPGHAPSDFDPPIGRLASNVNELLTGQESQAYRADPLGVPGLRGASKDSALLMEELIANSPASRGIGFVRGLADKDKWKLNGLPLPPAIVQNVTGLRITDVRPHTRDAILNEYAGDLLKKLGAQEFSTTFIPAELYQGMHPSDQRDVDQLKLLQALLAKRRKARAAERQQSLFPY